MAQRTRLVQSGAVVAMLCLVQIACGDRVLRTAITPAPDGNAVVRSELRQSRGFFTSRAAVVISIEPVGTGTSQELLVIESEPDRMGDLDVGVAWLSPSRLELTYRAGGDVRFQAIKWTDVEVLVRERPWPKAREVEAQARIVVPTDDVTDSPFALDLADANGRTAYRLECHNWNYDGPGGLTYSGTFHCGLFAVDAGRRTSSNLLADSSEVQRRSDWYNRGRMLSEQLRGVCAPSPWGTVRAFRLRGMRLTLTFDSLTWRSTAPPALKAFTFKVSVKSDPSATTETAEPAAVAPEIMAACLPDYR